MNLHCQSSRRRCAFTMIELLVVIAIMGIFLAIGMPSIVGSLRKEGMRKATSDLVEACAQARANAILSGSPVDLVIRPLDGTLSVGGAAAVSVEDDPFSDRPAVSSSGSARSFSAQFPENIVIEILGVNFIQFEEAEEARVRFYPNGTSDEFTIVLRSLEGEARKISLEVLTALADVEVLR